MNQRIETVCDVTCYVCGGEIGLSTYLERRCEDCLPQLPEPDFTDDSDADDFVD